MCEFIFAASFKGRKKKLIISLKVCKYYLGMFSRTYLTTFGKILQHVFRRFCRVATIAGKGGKAGKLIFFWSLAGKARKPYPFLLIFLQLLSVHPQLQWSSTCYFLSLQIEQESDCTYKNKICCISIYWYLNTGSIT